MPTISERVARGTAWLDENRPGWIDEIDLDRLLMSSPCNCVLGQLYGNYFEVIWGDPVAPRPPDGRSHGFNAYDAYDLGGTASQLAEYDDLHAEWVRVITERREAATNA